MRNFYFTEQRRPIEQIYWTGEGEKLLVVLLLFVRQGLDWKEEKELLNDRRLLRLDIKFNGGKVQLDAGVGRRTATDEKREEEETSLSY